MLMRGRCGFASKEEMSSVGGMSEVTPAKWWSKNFGSLDVSASRYENSALGRKSVQVNEPSYIYFVLVHVFGRGTGATEA